MRRSFGIRSIWLSLFAIFAAAGFLLAEPPGVPVAQSLRWKNTSIRIAISSSITSANPNIKIGTDVKDVIRRSFSNWERVSSIKFAGFPSDKLSVSSQGISGDGISLITIAQTPENLALFQSDWQSVPARTRIFYNRKGEITEGDIVLNPYVQFSDDGTFGTFDLESTLTHEIGHLLGLGHSFSAGSVMYANAGRNGLFGLPVREARAVSPEDIAALHAIYGAAPDEASCCGQVAGRLMQPGAKGASFEVWAEDAESGVVNGCTTSERSGSYRIDGLPSGNYRIFAQDRFSKSAASATELGKVTVDEGKAIVLNRTISAAKTNLDLRYLGLNSQLADAAIPLNPGRTYTIYLGGSRLDALRTAVGSNSPFVSVAADTLENVDFNDDVSVIRAEITISPKTPAGNYSIFVKSNGVSRYIVGAISVNTF